MEQDIRQRGSHIFLRYIHHTVSSKQYCRVGTQWKAYSNQVYSKMWTWIDSKSSSGCVLCMFGSFTLLPHFVGFKKTDCDQHSSNEAEILPPIRLEDEDSVSTQPANVQECDRRHRAFRQWCFCDDGGRAQDCTTPALARTGPGCSRERPKSRYMTRQTQTSHRGPK